MRKYFLVLIFIFACIILFPSLSAGNWQNVGGDIQHSGYSEGSYVPLELIWKYKVGNSDISAPIVDRGTLFVGSDDNNLYALDASTGKLKWQYPALGKVYTPAAKDGLVFAASFDNYLYALDSNGNLRWKTSTGSSIASPPVVYNDILYGGFDKYIYAIYVINGSIKWTYATDGWIESTPAISQGTVYAGSNDRKIYALDIGNKNLRWSFTTGGSLYSSPSVVNGVIFFGSRDNNIYAIDSIDGSLKWSSKTNDWVKSSPAVFENRIFVGSNDNSIYALNSDNGDVLWKYPTNGRVESPPIIIKGTVYAGSDDGTIYAIDPDNGKLINKYEIGEGIVSLALSDNMLFASSKDGYVYAFGAQLSEIKTTIPAIQTDKNPPLLIINTVPVNVTYEKLKISGFAEDTSGILVVTVNGVEAGTNIWNTTITLLPGPNIITIVAVDKSGNIKTESRTVSYIPSPVNPETPSTPGFSFSVGFVLFITIVFLKKFKN